MTTVGDMLRDAIGPMVGDTHGITITYTGQRLTQLTKADGTVVTLSDGETEMRTYGTVVLPVVPLLGELQPNPATPNTRLRRDVRIKVPKANITQSDGSEWSVDEVVPGQDFIDDAPGQWWNEDGTIKAVVAHIERGLSENDPFWVLRLSRARESRDVL